MMNIQVFGEGLSIVVLGDQLRLNQQAGGF